MHDDAAPPLGEANYGVLPADVLYDILLLLPANELCRLRLVCRRSWRSLTSDLLLIRQGPRTPGAARTSWPQLQRRDELRRWREAPDAPVLLLQDIWQYSSELGSSV
ncbi:unnamed protein product [Urochloa humidicola]